MSLPFTYCHCCLTVKLTKLFVCHRCYTGEEALSYGYGGTGKASTECNFVDYGQTFGPGDVITAYLVRLDVYLLSFYVYKL